MLGDYPVATRLVASRVVLSAIELVGVNTPNSAVTSLRYTVQIECWLITETYRVQENEITVNLTEFPHNVSLSLSLSLYCSGRLVLCTDSAAICSHADLNFVYICIRCHNM
jgi:hypothetical protein